MPSFCPSCGQPMAENQSFCSSCGAAVNQQQAAPQQQFVPPQQPYPPQYAQQPYPPQYAQQPYPPQYAQQPYPPQYAQPYTQPDPETDFDDDTSTHSRTAVMLFALFLGNLGVHRYASGRGVLGTVHLLLLVFGILIVAAGVSGQNGETVTFGYLLIAGNSVWAFVEWIMALCGALQDEDGYYIRRW